MIIGLNTWTQLSWELRIDLFTWSEEIILGNQHLDIFQVIQVAFFRVVTIIPT